MAVDEAKRRQMEELARRGRSHRDADASRKSQVARNAHGAGILRGQMQQEAGNGSLLTDREKAMMKQVLKDGVVTDREKAVVKQMAEKKIDSFREKAEEHLAGLSDPKPGIKTQEGAFGKAKDALNGASPVGGFGASVNSDAGFNLNFKQNFFGIAVSRMAGHFILGGFRSDGLAIPDKEKIMSVLGRAGTQKVDLSGAAQNLAARAANLQALINEKGLYTGTALDQQVQQSGPSF